MIGDCMLLPGEFVEEVQEVGERRRCEQHGEEGAWAEKGRDDEGQLWRERNEWEVIAWRGRGAGGN